MGDEPHAERCRAARHLLPDAAKSRQPEDLVAHLLAEKLLLLPFALLHGGVGCRQVPGERKHERHGQLRDAHAAGASGAFMTDNASRTWRGHVHVVHAGAGAGDGTQTRGGGNQCGSHLRGAANDDASAALEIFSQRVPSPA